MLCLNMQHLGQLEKKKTHCESTMKKIIFINIIIYTSSFFFKIDF